MAHAQCYEGRSPGRPGPELNAASANDRGLNAKLRGLVSWTAGARAQCYKGRTTGARVRCYEGRSPGQRGPEEDDRAPAQCSEGRAAGARP